MRLRLLALLLLLVPGAAQATTVGFGYGFRLNQVTLPPFNDGSLRKTGFSGLIPTHVLSLYDGTGILASAMGTAGNEYMARERAQTAARNDPRTRAGDRVQYSYENVPPAPGLLTTFDITFGDSGKVMPTYADGSTLGKEATISHIGFLLAVGMWSAPLGPLTFGLDISAIGQWYGAKAENYKNDVSRIHVGVGGALNYDLPFNLLLSAKLDLAPTSLLNAAIGYKEWLDFALSARLGWRPIPIVYAFVDAGYVVSGLDDVSLTALQVSANVALLFDIGGGGSRSSSDDDDA